MALETIDFPLAARALSGGALEVTGIMAMMLMEGGVLRATPKLNEPTLLGP